MKVKINLGSILLPVTILFCQLSYADNQEMPFDEHAHHGVTSSSKEHENHKNKQPDNGLNQMDLPAELPSKESLYNLTSTWSSSLNKQIQLSHFKGKPVVIFMAYTSCEFSCPIIVSLAKKIEANLANRALDTQFVFVTFDALKDTPEKLHAYAQRMELNYDFWSLLHGSEDDIRELAILLGIAFRKDSKGVFSHSNVIAVLNQEGEIVHRQIGLTAEVAQTVTVVRKLLPETK